MPDRPDVDVSLVNTFAQQWQGRPLAATDANAVASLLNGLAADMQAFSRLTIADADEPATIYVAVEGQP